MDTESAERPNEWMNKCLWLSCTCLRSRSPWTGEPPKHRHPATSQTSFKWLTTRNNSWIFRHVNKGRPRRRIVMFGLLQLAYTVVTFAAVMPLYRSFWGVMAWQIAKTAFALWYGAQYQCEAIPKVRDAGRSHAVLLGWRKWGAGTIPPVGCCGICDAPCGLLWTL